MRDDGSTYRQHMNYYREQGRHQCARLLFLEDLRDQLAEWAALGDELIVGLDANEDVRDGAVKDMFSSLNMRDAVLSRHGNNPPETMNRNSNQEPIDAIFVSRGINISAAGYTDYGDFIDSDHRSVWIDVPFTSVLGHNPPNYAKKKPEKLKPDDPRVRDRYIMLVKKRYRHFDNFVPKQAAYVESLLAMGAPLQVIVAEHDKLVVADFRARMWAAQRCRPIYTGLHAWSPKWAQAI
ncbi:expressed unknown protein [Seminavis robusta]|uniref:Uncharacterized protein n=1 Tax=Seminavis robusta TaxID=568900 RepID=A0A9N8EZX8_9STRA|nr:expressed unknown protein [Seminavis robusta]|eukprot:Sro3292_g346280.1 n/a (237) ;mRNA; f:5915-6625